MLTAAAIKNVRPKDKPYKLADERGLYLLVTPSGGKLWRYKYRHAGKEKLLALGAVDDVTLAEARDKRDDARKLLKAGVDPSGDRKRAKLTAHIAAENSFKAVALEWYGKQKNLWTTRHAGYVLRRMTDDLFPDLGGLPVAQIEPPQILACLRKIEARGAHEMARRGRQYCSAVFCYAIATGRAQRDSAADIRKALEAAPPERHVAALDQKELKEFFKRLRDYDGHPQTLLAIRLLMLTAARTSELIGAKWSEIEDVTWCVPAERMKMKRDHLVPLSKQALMVLSQLRSISGATDFLFPSPRNLRAPMSNNTILFALYRMGYHSRATGHGMRTLFSTVLNELHDTNGHRIFHKDVIERQLAHVETNSVRGAYNRAEWLPERRTMMQFWGDYLAKSEG